ncbi:hypothetical protein ILP92_02640 [Maribius pontilimi]|uniref:Uncharacterized protein n=1 Tax=Palleronia pontilimi TaxID=1964209 RepID=A0A934I7G7_9RHOB|nr:hypothetical protein [Palleronia pontilimi]MBJ3761648.1 hypothetical protein [Palleronia pontilimi]
MLLVPAIALAGAFDGLWRSNPTAECVYVDGDAGALKIEDDVLFGAESRCRMTQPVNVRDMDAVLYDMACDGEGSSWTDRAMFLSAADGGLYLIWNGYAFKYEQCAEDAALGTVATAGELGISDDLGVSGDAAPTEPAEDAAEN